MKEQPRQHIERVGRRRVRLTAVAGTIADADTILPRDASDAATPDTGPAGPNDARMLRERPPHY